MKILPVISQKLGWMFTGVQDSDIRALRRHTAAESHDERVEERGADVCRESHA